MNRLLVTLVLAGAQAVFQANFDIQHVLAIHILSRPLANCPHPQARKGRRIY